MTLQDAFASVSCGICGAGLTYTGGKNRWTAATSGDVPTKPHKHSPVPVGTPAVPGEFLIKEKAGRR